jgi:hypothetical protein
MVDVAPFREHCTFGPGRVHLLLAVARAKDNEGDAAADVPTIRAVVTEGADLPRTAAELDHAVSRFDARYRLYVTVNARDATTAVFELRSDVDDWLRMRLGGDEDVVRKFERLDSEFTSVLQSDRCADESNFLFDLDDVDRPAAERFRDRLAGHTDVSLFRETPNGFHVVTGPFDYTRLSADVDYELETDDLVFVDFVGT